MRKQIDVVILLLAAALCQGAERFQLESELCRNYSVSGTKEFLTGYTYDADGNRVQSRVWSGSDSMTTPLSSVKFTYDINGRCTEELLLSGADTLTIVRYAYGDGKLLAVRTLRKDLTLRFTDSLLYDGHNRKIEERRISSAGALTFFHHYTLDVQGKTVADSLYELIGSSFNATQAVLFTYNPDSTVATETQWRLSGTGWYCINTAFMRYAVRVLASVVTYERDGAGTAMTDSMAYAYDGFGNRIREEAYDQNRALTSKIVYTWRDTQTSIALKGGNMRNNQRTVLSSKQGLLMIDLSPRDRGEISLYTMAGKRMYRMSVNHSAMVPLHGLAGKGPYVAVFTGSTNKQIMNFPNYN